MFYILVFFTGPQALFFPGARVLDFKYATASRVTSDTLHVIPHDQYNYK